MKHNIFQWHRQDKANPSTAHIKAWRWKNGHEVLNWSGKCDIDNSLKISSVCSKNSSKLKLKQSLGIYILPGLLNVESFFIDHKEMLFCNVCILSAIWNVSNDEKMSWKWLKSKNSKWLIQYFSTVVLTKDLAFYYLNCFTTANSAQILLDHVKGLQSLNKHNKEKKLV